MIYWISWLIMCPFVLLLLPTRIIGKKYLKKTKKQSKSNDGSWQVQPINTCLQYQYTIRYDVRLSGLFLYYGRPVTIPSQHFYTIKNYTTQNQHK